MVLDSIQISPSFSSLPSVLQLTAVPYRAGPALLLLRSHHIWEQPPLAPCQELVGDSPYVINCQESFLEVSFAIRLKRKDSHMKGIYTLICEEHHIHSFAYILTPYSRIVRSFKQLQLSQYILHILLDSQLLETGSCLGYLYVVICENGSLSGTTPKTPCYISTQNITPFAHDYSPYQTRSKKITLGRKKTGTWMSIYRR